MRLRTTIFAIALLVIPAIVSASPGGLDANGCHVCRTNCAAYHLETGERHCHRVAKQEETISAHVVTAKDTKQIDFSNVVTGIAILLLGIACGAVVWKNVFSKPVR